jgi:uncharacterized membrane protein YdjX (TVP38/TMEM64 family)
LGSLMGAFILSITVVAGLGIGILTAYLVVMGLLHAFAAQSRKPGRDLMVAQQARAAHAGGD